MKILLIGPQGCGKGTQGDMLGNYLDIPVLASGQILRNVPEISPYYALINDYMDKGLLVPQDLVASLLREEIAKPVYAKGFILDGWGRAKADLVNFDPGFDSVININISDATSIERLSSRLTCSECGSVYNTTYMLPKVSGICDDCGGRLVQRDDDTEAAIKKRLEIYHTQTQEVLDYFRQKGNLIAIDGEGTPEEVFTKIKTALKI